MSHTRVGSFVALIGAIGVVVGCGPSVNQGASAVVSGSITYKGTPLGAGRMSFVKTDGMSYDATISADGTYQATGISTGELIVTVDTEHLNKPKMSAAASKEAALRAGEGGQKAPAGRSAPSTADLAKEEASRYVKIPAKYKNAKTSPLSYTLKSGRQIINIELTD